MNLKKTELLAAFVISFFSVSLAFLPIFYAGWKTPPGYFFTGMAQFPDAYDAATYLSTVRQGFEGAWLWRNFYGGSGQPLPLYLPYLFLGHLARFLNLPLLFTLSSATFIAGVFLLLVVYVFSSFFLESTARRLFCLICVALGGGWGWLFLPFGRVLPDLAFPDFTVFPMLRTFHFLLEGMLFLLSLLLLFLASVKPKPKYRWWLVLTSLPIFTIHPYMAVVLFLIAAVYLVLTVSLRQLTWRQVVSNYWPFFFSRHVA